jgi:hypothetical protein
MASIINASTAGGGGVITTADASGILNLQSGGTTIAAVSSTGVAVTGTGVFSSTIKGATTISVGNATPAASGAGITFPATQSASTDANTLDDYEEGTFTPTTVGSTIAGAGTYTTQTGRYTKIGRMVYITAFINQTAHTGTGNMRLASLPFTSANNANIYSIFPIDSGNLTVPANAIPFLETDTNTTVAIFATWTTGGSGIGSLAMDASCTLYCNLYYEVA